MSSERENLEEFVERELKFMPRVKYSIEQKARLLASRRNKGGAFIAVEGYDYKKALEEDYLAILEILRKMQSR